MRKILSIPILLLTLLFACTKRDLPDEKAEIPSETKNKITPYYYYYKNQKLYLDLNMEYAFASLKTDQNISLPSDLPVTKTKQKREDLSAKMKSQFRNSRNYTWAEYSVAGIKTTTDYFALLDKMKKDENIETTAPYFKNIKGEKVGLSNFFYVKLKTEGDYQLLQELSAKQNVAIIEQNRFMPLWYTLSCSKSSQFNAMQLANIFYESGQFKYAEPDLIVDKLLQCTTSDPLWSSQWNLYNTGQYSGTAGADVKACDAWGISKGDGITVAVIDQGIDKAHEDLSANIHPSSYDALTHHSPSWIWGWHGTECAGVIGADDNSVGISGIAPNCKLMDVSHELQSSTTIASELADAINWAWQHGADVLSNSWGNSSLTSSMIDDAIDDAITLGRNGKGCVVVFASGNDNSSVTYPASSNPDIIAVGAMSPCYQRKTPSSCDLENWWGSNYGAQLDVVAPGVLITTTDHMGAGGDNTSGNYYTTFNGTSSACPLVSGIAALILSANPTYTAAQVRDIIESTATKAGSYSYTTTSGRPNGTWNSDMGYGLVNAYAALVSATTPSGTDIEGRFFKNIYNGKRYIGMRGKYREIFMPLHDVFNSGATINYISINATPPSPVLGSYFPSMAVLPMSYGWDDPVTISTSYIYETSTSKWYMGEFTYLPPGSAALSAPLQLNLTELTSITNTQYQFKNVTLSTADCFINYYGYAPLPDMHPLQLNTVNTNDIIYLSSINNPIYVYDKQVYLNKLSNLPGH